MQGNVTSSYYDKTVSQGLALFARVRLIFVSASAFSTFTPVVYCNSCNRLTFSRSRASLFLFFFLFFAQKVGSLCIRASKQKKNALVDARANARTTEAQARARTNRVTHSISRLSAKLAGLALFIEQELQDSELAVYLWRYCVSRALE